MGCRVLNLGAQGVAERLSCIITLSQNCHDAKTSCSNSANAIRGKSCMAVYRFVTIEAALIAGWISWHVFSSEGPLAYLNDVWVLFRSSPFGLPLAFADSSNCLQSPLQTVSCLNAT